METSPYQSIESQMPPRTDREYGDTSFTGLPSSLLEAARDLAKQRKTYPRDVFQDAIAEFIPRLDAGESIDWPLSRPKVGTVPYHTRLEVDVLEVMRAACDRHHLRKSIFFMTALRDYLRKHGFEIEV
jgi:hypothetical protein